MKKFLFSRLALGVGVVLASGVALPAPAAMAAAPSPGACPGIESTQAFLSYHDHQWYTLAPGESSNSFDGTGWVLSNGANVATTTLADGSAGPVLDLPPGSSATSPIMCVQAGMPLARMMTRMVNGPQSNATSFEVWNAGGNTLGGAMPVLGKTSWMLSPPVTIVPGMFSGVKEVYFTFTAKQTQGDLQLYNFYIDPRMW